MDFMTYVQAVLLGILEAGTEFLPVSSTGHLLLAGHFFGFEGPPGKVFEVVIQLGAILAVCVLYFRKLWGVLLGLPTRPEARRFAAVILIGFLPAMVLGAGLHGFVKTYAFNPWVVSVMLVVGGVAILLLEKAFLTSRIHAVEEIPLPVALRIGVVQCLALVPGVSRSGASILGGLWLGLDRKTAAEFSFFLAIPTMVGAVAFDLFKNRDVLSVDDIWLIMLGLLSAFLAALGVVKWLVGFVSRHGFAPFAWYRIGLGSLCLGLLILGF